MSYAELRKQRTPGNRYTDERYVLNGLNLASPDQLISKGEAAKALNCRMFAREQDDKRVAIKTRKGAAFYSTPIGQTQDQAQTSTTGAADQDFNSSIWLGQKFTAGASGRLTMIELNLKKDTGTGTVLVALYSDSAGAPSTQLAISGIPGSSVVASYGYLKFRFIQAPQVASGTAYWIVVYAQDDATNTYNVSSTTNTTLASSSSNNGGTWTPQSWSMNYRTHVSTNSPVLGGTRRYADNGTKETLMAHGTSVYKIADVDGSTTAIKTGQSALATRYQFAKYNDKNIWVNGYDSAQQYDGTTVSNLTTPQTPRLVMSHKNRLYFVPTDDDTRVFFSDLGDETTYAGTNFFYVPAPKSADPITAWCSFQDNMVIFTKETKYMWSGDGSLVGSTLRQSIGGKGAVSQDAVYSDRNYVYFVAEDGIYRWNGSTDELLSDKIQPAFDAVSDKSKMTISFWNNQLRVYYPSASSAINNEMFLFDLVYEQWFSDDMVYADSAIVLSQDAGNPLVEFSSLVGAAYYGEQAYSSLGAPLYLKYWTAYNKYLSGSSKDRIKIFRPILRPSGFTYVMQIGKDINFKNAPDMRDYEVATTGATWGGGWTWGASSSNPTIWGSSTLVDGKTGMSGRGKHTQYRFERYGANTPVELYGYIAIIKSGRIR